MAKRLLLISVGILPQYSGSTAGGGGLVPRLALACIAAVTPEDWEIKIISDLRKEDIPMDETADVVGFSILTPFANASYEIAEHYRKRGAKVVMGGQHTSLMPHEALNHADAVVVGEGEYVWPILLADLMNGKSLGIYKGNTPVDLNLVPRPRVDLYDRERYSSVALVNTERGCPFHCGWCLTPGREGKYYRMKHPEMAAAEVWALKNQLNVDYFSLVDCSVNNRPFILRFAKEIRDFNMHWTGSGVIEAFQHQDVLEAIAEAGCDCIYIETEAISKSFKPIKYQKVLESIKMARRLGIKCHYNFTFGYDTHDPGIFQQTSEFIERAEMDLYIFQIYTPWPATPEYQQIMSENRILSTDWDRYNNAYAIHQPKLMSVAQLEEGVAQMYERFFSGSYFEAVPLFNLNTFNHFVSFYV